MTDTPTAEIVKRLRRREIDIKLFNSAASRLQQLEAQLVVAQSLCQNWQDGSVRLHREIEQLEAENKRLTEALQSIASCEAKFPGDVVNVARAALSSTRGET